MFFEIIHMFQKTVQAANLSYSLIIQFLPNIY